jgi:hypothetical protein
MVQEPISKRGPIAVKPYINQSVDNMGLQNYGLALFEGVYHEEQLACIEHNGIKRYVTGLNEFAPEIKLLKDPEVKEAKRYYESKGPAKGLIKQSVEAGTNFVPQIPAYMVAGGAVHKIPLIASLAEGGLLAKIFGLNSYVPILFISTFDLVRMIL